jgi:hypothetical protein
MVVVCILNYFYFAGFDKDARKVAYKQWRINMILWGVLMAVVSFLSYKLEN